MLLPGATRAVVRARVPALQPLRHTCAQPGCAFGEAGHPVPTKPITDSGVLITDSGKP